MSKTIPDAFASSALAAALAAMTLAFVAGFASAQPQLEDVVRPRIDHYEQVVQDQLTAGHDTTDRLRDDAGAKPAELAAAFGLLGQLYLLYDFPTPAGAALRNAEALTPSDPRWPYYLADLAATDGEPELAAASLDRALSLDPGNLAALVRRGDARFELGRIDDADADYRRVLDRDPRQSAARFGLGRISYERGEYERAIELFEGAILDQQEGSVIHHHIGLALRRLGRREEAAAHFKLNEHRVVRFPDRLRDLVDQLNVSSEAHYFRGTAALRRGNARAALDAFLQALEAQPDNARTVFSAGLAQIELGNKKVAEARMRQAIALDPSYREPHFNLALILAERREYEEAEQHFRRATEIDTSDFESSARRADALIRLGRIEEAVRVLKQVLEAEPAMPVAQLTLGAAYQAAGDPERARANLEQVLAAAPGAPRERAEAHYRLALIADEDPTDALTHLRRALALDSTLPEAHALLGRMLAQRRQFTEAASHFARAISRDPANAEWHRDRAMALILGHRYAAARGALTSGLVALRRSDIASSKAAADHLRLLLSRLLSTCPDAQVRDGQESLAIARQLMAEEPSLDRGETMAMALAETGDFDQASAVQRQILTEVRRRGGEPTAGQKQRLEAYLNGEAVREPWFSP